MRYFGNLGSSWEALGVSWGALGASWEVPGSVLGASWEALGSIFDRFGRYFGVILGLGNHRRSDVLKL